MAMDELHKRVAAVALGAAAEHGFALGGGNALIAHGVISRPTQDVDLFTNREHGVEAAKAAVESALREAGFQAESEDKSAGLSDVFYGMGEGLAEWTVTEPGGRAMALQMAYFDRGNEPVIMEFGPVLDLEDVIGGKVCALAGRAYPRDFLDTSAALARYTPDELISLARRLDPGLEGEDFADAARRLDQLPDSSFAQFGLDETGVAELRERFAAWPREAEPRREPDPGLEWDEPARDDLETGHDVAGPAAGDEAGPDRSDPSTAGLDTQAPLAADGPGPAAELPELEQGAAIADAEPELEL